MNFGASQNPCNKQRSSSNNFMNAIVVSNDARNANTAAGRVCSAFGKNQVTASFGAGEAVYYYNVRRVLCGSNLFAEQTVSATLRKVLAQAGHACGELAGGVRGVMQRILPRLI